MEHLKSFKAFESVTKHVFNNRVEYRNDKGKLHREDGPAVEWNNGSKIWYLNGQLHREDGPALEYDDGSEDWFLNDINFPKSLFIQNLTHQQPNPNLFRDLPIEDLEELSNDLCDKYIGEVKQWFNFYAIYFKEKLDKNDLDLKSFENRLKDSRIGVGVKSIIVY